LLLRPGEPSPAGLRLRPRALLTTLFARLCLADGFVHGIGGAKYDEVTDGLIERWLGLRPPRYFVLTATLRLPLPAFPTDSDAVRSATHAVRDLIWNPQRHLRRAVPEDLLIAKEKLIRDVRQGRAKRREWFASLRSITEQLRPYVADQIESAKKEHARRAAEWSANRKLRRRDFAWCLFPEELIRPCCQRFLDLTT
jgi:hypothetical protein